MLSYQEPGLSAIILYLGLHGRISYDIALMKVLLISILKPYWVENPQNCNHNLCNKSGLWPMAILSKDVVSQSIWRRIWKQHICVIPCQAKFRGLWGGGSRSLGNSQSYRVLYEYWSGPPPPPPPLRELHCMLPVTYNNIQAYCMISCVTVCRNSS